MACIHLNQLYQLCQSSNIKLSSSDLIRVVCKQCEKEEVCPSVLVEEYQSAHLEADSRAASARNPPLAVLPTSE